MSYYLTKDSSRAIKGLLIFLIVLGHNAVFTTALPKSFSYIYLFHVQAFFILPFLYKKEKEDDFKTTFGKNFIRLYYPFIVFFILLSILNYIVTSVIGKNIDLHPLFAAEDQNVITTFISTLLTGNQYLIDHFTAMHYLWFLPVMFSLNILRYFQGKKGWQILSVIGIVSYIVFIVFMYHKPYSDRINFEIMKYSPFAILQALGVFFLGTSFVYILRNTKFKKVINASPIIFIILSLVYWFLGKDEYIYYSIRFIMPYIFMGMLYVYRAKFEQITYLKKFGDLSFQIYIIHPLLCHAMFLFFNSLIGINILYGIIVQIVVFTISYYIAIFINKWNFIRILLFPRSFKELKGLFSHK